MLDTIEHLEKITFPAISRNSTQTLQLNLGYKCNLQCLHCHVNAGPNRKEEMTDETLAEVKRYALSQNIKTIDLTGGAPEMHPKFKALVAWAFEHKIHVINRSNLTILLEPGYEGFVELFKEYKVEVVASMPCYLKENVDKQRGKGTFDKSIEGLQRLNAAGFGQEGTGLMLNLVFNSQGASLPPAQAQLQVDYKKHLSENYGVNFNDLLVITNVPIARFGSMLLSKGEFSGYMNLLQENYQAANLAGLMCKYLLSIDWQGYVYDCDFNQMLELPVGGQDRLHISALNYGQKIMKDIIVKGHCYACTAGQGSSCSGVLTEAA